ncbi:MAG: DUF4175 family protein [Verrucomicrobiia bacterium]
MMSDSFENQRPEVAKRRLTEASRSKDLSARLAWTLGIGEGILLAIGAVALADYWLVLPVWIRSIAAGVVALLALSGIVRLAGFLRRPTAIKEAALDLEAARPELGCEISTAAEYLAGERQVMHEYEPELVAALEAKAAAELGRAQIPYERRLILPAALVALTGMAALIYFAFAPEMLTALRRTVFPLSEAHYTQVQVQPGSVEVPVGSNLDITNIFTGRIPKAPEFHWRQEGSQAWQTAPLTASGDGTYLHSLQDIRQSLQYRVTGGDAASETFQVEAYIPPEVKELNVRIESPSYTDRAPGNQLSPDITALRGSKVQIEVQPSTALSSAKLRFPGATNEMTLVPGPGGLWTAQLTVTNHTEYWIDLFDQKGRRGGSTNAHPIHALPDTPPVVVIQSPGQDMRASATNRIPLTIAVADDFGVQDIRIVFHKLDAPEQVLSVSGTPSGKRQTANAELDLSRLDLEQFDVVAYHAEAKDNNTLDGPGVGKSPVYFVEITQSKSGPPNPQPPSPTLNLLAVQKQIIADTANLEPGSPAEAFGSLAVRQDSAAEFGQIYLTGLQRGRAPPQAVTEMNSALSEMTAASASLNARKRDDALPAEERALTHLYQVLKQLPELENLPTEPRRSTNAPPSTTLAIVLEAIREKKQLPTPEAQSLQEALEQAQALADAQAAVNAALREAQRAGGDAEQGQAQPQNQAQAQGQGQQSPQGQEQAQGQAQAQAQGRGKGKGKGQGQGQGEGEGEGQGQGKGQGEKMTQAGQKPDQRTDQAMDKGQGKEGDQQSDDPEKPGDSQDQAASKNESDSENQGEGEGKGKGTGQTKAQGQGEGQNQQAQAQGQGQGQGPGEGDGKAQGQGQPKDGSKSGERETESTNPADLARQEAELQKLAAELAAKLEKLVGKDARVTTKAGQNARVGSHKIANALDEIRKGRFGAAGVYGFQGELALREVVAQLQRAVRARPELTDIASEEAPKEFEGLISEYLKRLSHAE